MKLSLALVLSFLSFSAFSYVDSKNCPEEFTITYSDITRNELTPEIRDNFIVYEAWSALKNVKNIQAKFKISTRSTMAMCVYVSGQGAALLQTNAGSDELLVALSPIPGHIRTAVASFSREHIEVVNDEVSRSIVAPKISNIPDAHETLGDVVVAIAKDVKVK